jgi:hypothetical protein
MLTLTPSLDLRSGSAAKRAIERATRRKSGRRVGSPAGWGGGHRQVGAREYSPRGARAGGHATPPPTSPPASLSRPFPSLPFRSPPGRNIPLGKGRKRLFAARCRSPITGISTRALGWSLSRAANSVVLITSSLGGGLEVYSVLSLLIPGSPAAAALRLPPAPGMDMTNLRSSDRAASLAYDRKTQRGTHTCQPRACRGPASTWRAAAHAA